jgi:hypothetical protein
MLLIGPSQRWKSTVAGANGICRHGSGMAAFEYRQASELHDALSRHGVRYLFIGKSGAILLGFPDTTQDADLFVEKSPDNGRSLAAALLDLGFALNEEQQSDLERGKDFVQLKNGPFDLTSSTRPAGSRDSPMRGNAAWK